MSMTKPDPERVERRRQQKEIAESLKSSGALDEIFARIDAGEPLTGHEGLLKGMLKATLERGLDAELSDHVGYDRGDPDTAAFANSRNGTYPKTVASEIGDVELAVPRDRNGTFTPMLVPKGVRRLDGLDAMIVSLYAGGMTVRDIGHHLESTIGTERQPETISKITDAVCRRGPGLAAAAARVVVPGDLPRRDRGQGPRRRPRAQQGRAHRGRRRHRRHQARAGDLGASHRGRQVLGVGVRRARQPGRRDVLIVCCDGLTGFPEAIEATWPEATVQTCVVHLIRAVDAVRELRRPQGRRRRAEADLPGRER